MFGYMMNTSDEVIENMLTHKVVKGRVPEADPTRAHSELNIEPNVKGDDMDQLLYLKEIREYYDTGDMDKEEASKDET